MKVLIDKKGDFGFVTTKEAFHGRILDRKHQEIATIEYDNSTQRAKLLITMGEDSISRFRCLYHLFGRYSGKLGRTLPVLE